MNKDLGWISAGSIDDFISKSKKVIDPHFDWFISSLIANVDNHNLNKDVRNNLTFFIYFLLNKRLQLAIKKIRIYLDIPQNGFVDIQAYYKWKNNFFKAINDYQKAIKIPKKQNIVITFIEKELVKGFGGRVSISDIFRDPEYWFTRAITKRLQIGNDRDNWLWNIFFYHIIFTFNPKELIESISNTANQYDKVAITHNLFTGSVDLVVPLSLKSTISSLQMIIYKNKGEILQTIKGMKIKSPKTKIETPDIKRDYFIYTAYISHKSSSKHGEDLYQNTRKELMVADMAEELLNSEQYEAIGNLDWVNMRKIVSRMNKRIKESFIDKADGISNFVELMRTTKPAPYPEYVAGRSVTH